MIELAHPEVAWWRSWSNRRWERFTAKCDARERHTRDDAQLAEDVAKVEIDRVPRQEHPRRDLLVRQALSDQGGHGLLSLGQAVPAADRALLPTPMVGTNTQVAQARTDSSTVSCGITTAVLRRRPLEPRPRCAAITLRAEEVCRVLAG